MKYHLWLDSQNRLQSSLSYFGDAAILSPEATSLLMPLKGQTLLQIFLQRAPRELLLQIAAATPASSFRALLLDPALRAAIAKTQTQVLDQRIPLHALPAAQRLAWLGDQDTITCHTELVAPRPYPLTGFAHFEAGQTYPLRTRLETRQTRATRPNITGQLEELVHTGRELAFDLAGAPIEPAHLVQHFVIPEAPAIATAKPIEYARALADLDRIQAAMLLRSLLPSPGGRAQAPGGRAPSHGGRAQALRYRRFQRHDLAADACVPGVILAWEPGLGKTLAIYTLALLQCGFTVSDTGQLQILKPALIIAPENLHAQIAADALDLLGLETISLLTAKDLPAAGRPLAPAVYITSYTAFCTNGTRKGAPSLADRIAGQFHYIAIDEAVIIAGQTSRLGEELRALNPPARVLATATPIKTRVYQIFPLAWWVAGGLPFAHPRWPFGPGDLGHFRDLHLQVERNLSAECEAKRQRKPKPRPKVTNHPCNLPALWRVLAPLINRRRKTDCGEEIVPKIKHTLRVPLGAAQAAQCQAVLQDDALPMMTKITQLRLIAAGVLPHGSMQIQPSVFTPKLFAVLTLVAQALERREQIILFSPFHGPLDLWHALLVDAGLDPILADGRTAAAARGQLSRRFQAVEAPVMLAGSKSMGAGHSYPQCNNILLAAYTHELDVMIQQIDRAHRLNSVRALNIWCVLCDRSADGHLEARCEEKTRASELVLDGQFNPTPEVELHAQDFLQLTRDAFGSAHDSVDEQDLATQWPALRARLTRANALWHGKAAVVEVLKIAPAEVPATWRDAFVWKRG